MYQLKTTSFLSRLRLGVIFAAIGVTLLCQNTYYRHKPLSVNDFWLETLNDPAEQ